MISDENMYAEAFELLGYMDKKDVMKIPIETLLFIKNNKNNSYISRIDKNDIYNRENVDSRTISLLTGLKLKYFSEDEEKKVILDNCKKMQKEKVKQYSGIFGKKVKNEINLKTENSELVETKQESIFQKIKKALKQLFK